MAVPPVPTATLQRAGHGVVQLRLVVAAVDRDARSVGRSVGREMLEVEPAVVAEVGDVPSRAE